VAPTSVSDVDGDGIDNANDLDIDGDSGGNEMIFIDPATAEVKRRERFSNPYHMELTPDARTLVVTSLRRDQVDIYQAAGWALQARRRSSRSAMRCASGSRHRRRSS
jgi:6-phosphogluconolactonase (cycloisomerase 2 family)